MCLIIYKKTATTVVPDEIITQTALENRDGFGITYLDTMQTTRTMDYVRAELMLQQERPYIAHYRYATRGKVGKDMCHPYRFSKGWLYSNGTVDGLGSSTVCDTQVVADFLSNMPKRHWKQLLAMTPTRFAVVEKSGLVSLHGNWIEKDGILYSKDVSVRKVTYYNGTSYRGGKWDGGYHNGYYAGKTAAAMAEEKNKTSASIADWQKNAPAAGVDEDYWEHEVMSKRLEANNEGQKQLDEWLRKANQENQKHTHPPIRFNSDEEADEVGATLMSEDELEDEKFGDFCALLEEYGFDYASSYSEYCEDMNGSLYHEDTGVFIAPEEVAKMPREVLEYILGECDPFVSRWLAAGADDDYDWADNHLIAVYGTLKYKKGNHGTLFPQSKADPKTTFKGYGRTIENLRMTIQTIPYVYAGDSAQGNHIAVEVYEVPSEEARARIDCLEGHPNFYTRRLTDIEMRDGSIITAWMYYIEQEPPIGTTTFYSIY